MIINTFHTELVAGPVYLTNKVESYYDTSGMQRGHPYRSSFAVNLKSRVSCPSESLPTYGRNQVAWKMKAEVICKVRHPNLLNVQEVFLEEKQCTLSHTSIKLDVVRHIVPPFMDEHMEAYGSPSLVTPEYLLCENISASSSMWALGNIVYCLLFASFAFYEEVLRHTFERILSAHYDIPGGSELAKDFIRGVIVKEPEKRLTLAQCMQHPWLKEK